VFAAGAIWLALRSGVVLEPRLGRAHQAADTEAYAPVSVGVDTALTSVTIGTRPTRALRPDSATVLKAEVRDAAGRLLPSADVLWSSGDSTVARVDPASGRVVGVHSGRAQIVAAHGRGRDSVVITVRRRGARIPVAGSVTLMPQSPVRAGDSTTLGALVLGARGDTLPAAELTWSSSDPGVAAVDALTGVVHALAPGTAVMTARSGAASGAVELTVVPGGASALQILGGRPMAVGENLELRVLARGRDGAELSGVAAEWSTSDPTVASVDRLTGEVRALGSGSARISARAGAASAWISVTVVPRPQPLAAAEDLGEGARTRAEAQLAAGIDACDQAIRSKDMRRIRALWRPTSRADESALERLSRVLRAGGTGAVGDRVDGSTTVGIESAAVEFSVPLTWTDRAGRRTAQAEFRAEFALNAGRWEMASCRLVGPPSF